MSDQPLEQTLAGRTIAVPETRELEVFTSMLERRGATVLRCPLVAILDAPDPAPVLEWIRWFVGGACDDLILLTGEGLRRLLACIDKNEPALRAGFLAQLTRVRASAACTCAAGAIANNRSTCAALVNAIASTSPRAMRSSNALTAASSLFVA